MVREFAQLARVPEPRLYAIPSEKPNTVAHGRNPKHSAVAVTYGLLRHMPPYRVRGGCAACSRTSWRTSRTATSWCRASRSSYIALVEICQTNSTRSHARFWTSRLSAAYCSSFGIISPESAISSSSR